MKEKSYFVLIFMPRIEKRKTPSVIPTLNSQITYSKKDDL